MKILGRASAAQVVAAYRFDFRVLATGLHWPEAKDYPSDANQLVIERMNVVCSSRRPLFFPLEAAWDVCEMPAPEFLSRGRSMWGEPPYTRSMAAAIDSYGRSYTPIEDTAKRLGEIRGDALAGIGNFGVLVGLAMGGELNGTCSFALLDGHHRTIAYALEGKLPTVIRMLVGSRPFGLGVAVLNGIPWPFVETGG
jgi:hypothetical protein